MASSGRKTMRNAFANPLPPQGGLRLLHICRDVFDDLVGDILDREVRFVVDGVIAKGLVDEQIEFASAVFTKGSLHSGIDQLAILLLLGEVWRQCGGQFNHPLLHGRGIVFAGIVGSGKLTGD